MATNRKRTPRSRTVPCIPPECFNWLCDGKHDPQAGPWKGRFFLMSDQKRELWLAHRDQVLAWWEKQFPGTKPSLWWKYEALITPQNAGRTSQEQALTGKGGAQ